jgi:ribosomal protein L14
MIRECTIFTNADNSGAKLLKCIKVTKDKKGKTNLGNFVKVSLKEYTNKIKLKKRFIYNAMPSLIKDLVTRKDGLIVKGGRSRALLFNDSFKFLGTRCKGLVLKELKKNTFLFKSAPKVVKYHNIHI